MFLISHILFEPIKRFFLGIGGLTRWAFFSFLNRVFDKNYNSNIESYTNNKNEFIDKNGFTCGQKNMFVSFAILITFLIVVEKI